MARNITIKKNYIRPKLHKSRSKTRSTPKLYKSTSRTRSNKKNKNKNISRSRSNSRLSKYDYGFSFRGGKKIKGGMDPEVDLKSVFEEDNQTNHLRRPGNWYGTNYTRQSVCGHMFNPEPEKSKIFCLAFLTTTNRFVSRPYILPLLDGWSCQFLGATLRLFASASRRGDKANSESFFY